MNQVQEFLNKLQLDPTLQQVFDLFSQQSQQCMIDHTLSTNSEWVQYYCKVILTMATTPHYFNIKEYFPKNEIRIAPKKLLDQMFEIGELKTCHGAVNNLVSTHSRPLHYVQLHDDNNQLQAHSLSLVPLLSTYEKIDDNNYILTRPELVQLLWTLQGHITTPQRCQLIKAFTKHPDQSSRALTALFMLTLLQPNVSARTLIPQHPNFILPTPETIFTRIKSDTINYSDNINFLQQINFTLTTSQLLFASDGKLQNFYLPPIDTARHRLHIPHRFHTPPELSLSHKQQLFSLLQSKHRADTVTITQQHLQQAASGRNYYWFDILHTLRLVNEDTIQHYRYQMKHVLIQPTTPNYWHWNKPQYCNINYFNSLSRHKIPTYSWH